LRWSVEGIALWDDFGHVVARKGTPVASSAFPSKAAASECGLVQTHSYFCFPESSLPLSVGVDADNRVVFVKHGRTLEIDGIVAGRAEAEMRALLAQLGRPEHVHGPDELERHLYYDGMHTLGIGYRDKRVFEFNLRFRITGE
jgi:hypothetical protein